MLRALIVGAVAAAKVPFWVRSRRIQRLVDQAPHATATSGSELAREWEPGDAARAAGPGGDEAASVELAPETRLALRATRAAVRRLAGLPLSPWRNTCLYRSIAECLVLRHYGVPAQVRIGVRNEAPPYGPIVAHAWVVYPGSTAHEVHVPLAAATRTAPPTG